MANKRGLGMGLDALIQPKEEISNRKTEETIIKEVDKIDINKIEPNSLQPRKSFNEDSLQELADSIKQHGMIEPLIVQKGKKGFYQIIAGERRWRASKIAGIKEVPVIVKEYSSQEVVEYHSLIEEYNLKQDEVAEKVSKSRVAITNALRLLKLDARVREMLIEDKIKSGHARALLSIEDGDLQYETATRIFDEKFSVRETEKLVKKILNGDNKKEEKALEEDEQLKIVYQGYEEKLKSIIGTKVHINRNKDGKKGKIEIEYYSPDEFERIVDLMSHLQ